MKSHPAANASQASQAGGVSPAPEAFAGGSLGRRVDQYLAAWLAERPLPPNLSAALRYSCLDSGKRVRPSLLLLACQAVGGDPERALPAAGAVELVHCFSLVHDDLPALDDDDLRRGRPTLHRHAGEAMAILAGDALLGLAFELIATKSPSFELAGRLCRELAQATDDMIAGQVWDTCPEWDPALAPLERLRTIHRNKTGALIRCACRMGAIAGDARPAELEAITEYGSALGLMFQVVDDILDVTQTTEHLGKGAHKDEQQGKLTYPGLLGLERSRAVVAEERERALAALAPLGPRAAALAEVCEWLAVRTH